MFGFRLSVCILAQVGWGFAALDVVVVASLFCVAACVRPTWLSIRYSLDGRDFSLAVVRAKSMGVKSLLLLLLLLRRIR